MHYNRNEPIRRLSVNKLGKKIAKKLTSKIAGKKKVIFLHKYLKTQIVSL